MQESQADKLDLIFIKMDGYDRDEAANFWQRIGAKNGNS